MPTFLLYFLAIQFSPVQTDPCSLYGGVYISTNRSHVDYIVFKEDSEAFADLLVYRQENKLFADAPGLWYFTTDQTFADFTIYFTDKKNQADFTIYTIDNESFAGCN